MLLESPANVPGQRVDGRIVDDDDGDVAVLLHRDADGGIFGHGRTPWSNGSIVDRGVDEGLDLAPHGIGGRGHELGHEDHADLLDRIDEEAGREHAAPVKIARRTRNRSEEHTSELQSLMRISYAVFCLKTNNNHPLK